MGSNETELNRARAGRLEVATKPPMENEAHEKFFRSLSHEEVHLVALKEYLYEGAWDEIAKDLAARKEGRPYVYKLETRIDEDLERIRRLREYEAKTGANLGTYLHLFGGEIDGEKS